MSESPREWLEADGFGGFASHTTTGARTRRYHALLLVARQPPTDRRVLVSGVDAVIESDSGRRALTSQTYVGPTESEGSVIHHEGLPVEATFDGSLWPAWTYDLGEDALIEHAIFVPRGRSLVILSWRWRGPRRKGVTLNVRPFLSGRDYHALHHENAEFNFKPAFEAGSGRLLFRPYETELGIVAFSNGRFAPEEHWYRNFLYTEDRERGLDCVEDLAAPGTFTFDLEHEALLVFGTEDAAPNLSVGRLEDEVRRLRESERARRTASTSPLVRAASAYVVNRGQGRTIVAGYPWFTDWGRDTFIALRGLSLATSNLEEARRILIEWSGAVSMGMLPNRFPDSGEAPEFNSVDASLWFIMAVHDLRRAEAEARFLPSFADEKRLDTAIAAILQGYTIGTRHGIRMDGDSLLAAGEPGVQLTWMDAKVGEYVVTPRIGKPVEIQALWINALRIGGQIQSRFADFASKAEDSFGARFWHEETGYLYDVVDVDHVPGRYDGRIRPNALFAVGGLPFQTLRGERARQVVDVAESLLLTPAGLRSLSPRDPQYRGSCQGSAWARDTAYHQGTVWPYLMGAFVEAWIRVRGGSDEARREARHKFFDPFMKALDPLGTGHLPEITDGDSPHTHRGCPFQAWSVGEALRLDQVVLSQS